MTRSVTARGAVGAVAVAVVVAGVAGTAASLVAEGKRPALEQVAPDAVLARAPSLRVACARCDRVSLAIRLQRPARAVSATVAGRPLELAGRERGDVYAGFLQPAGIREMHVTPPEGEVWWGSEAPSPVVRLRIAYADGSVAETLLHVHLMAG